MPHGLPVKCRHGFHGGPCQGVLSFFKLCLKIGPFSHSTHPRRVTLGVLMIGSMLLGVSLSGDLLTIKGEKKKEKAKKKAIEIKVKSCRSRPSPGID